MSHRFILPSTGSHLTYIFSSYFSMLSGFGLVVFDKMWAMDQCYGERQFQGTIRMVRDCMGNAPLTTLTHIGRRLILPPIPLI